MRAVDGYCERTGPEYWGEPINALTYLASLLSAVFMWRPSAVAPLAQAMCVVLAMIGIGSFLFHTHAQIWAGLADVAPIALFILLYIFAVNRDAVGLGPKVAIAATALFIPYAGMMVPLFSMIPGLGASAGYAPVPLLILIYAAFLRDKHPDFARGMAIGAIVLIVSLTFRTLDIPLCSQLPFGTHFAWHILNGAMLGWMIEVYRRHRLGKHAHAR